MATITKQQPMRPAEIELIDGYQGAIDDAAEAKKTAETEVTDRKNADDALQNNIDAEANARTAADDALSRQIANWEASGAVVATFTVSGTGTSDTNDILVKYTATCDKTFAELESAIKDGKQVIGVEKRSTKYYNYISYIGFASYNSLTGLTFDYSGYLQPYIGNVLLREYVSELLIYSSSECTMYYIRFDLQRKLTAGNGITIESTVVGTTATDTISAASSTLLVPFTVDSEGNLDCNISRADIKAAYDNGRFVYATLSDVVYPLQSISGSDDDISCVFKAVYDGCDYKISYAKPLE